MYQLNGKLHQTAIAILLAALTSGCAQNPEGDGNGLGDNSADGGSNFAGGRNLAPTVSLSSNGLAVTSMGRRSGHPHFAPRGRL